MHNPFDELNITGTWADHASYSQGGTDYPTAYGTAVAAPASGTLEYDGWCGSAGRRATLYLDRPVKRAARASQRRMHGGDVEAAGPLVAIVFQHLSEAPRKRHVVENDPDLVRSGASANTQDFGGDVHMHVHGLDEGGRRLDFTKFIGSEEEEFDVAIFKSKQNPDTFAVRPGWQRFPVTTTPRTENIAAGTGGAGLYDMTLNLYLEDFTQGDQVEGRFVLENARTHALSNGYRFTVDGSPTGLVEAAIPAKVQVPARSRLFLELRAIRGAPSLTLWGVQIANLKVK
jgi:hypothetical protein